MASRKLEDCDNAMAAAGQLLRNSARLAGIEILITCTYRSDEEQQKLYRQGRTEPGSIVTHAQAGQSLHNCMIGDKPASRAIDVVPVINGKLIWGTQGHYRPIWEKVARIGKECGLIWGGDWEGKKCDFAHFELPPEKG